MRRSCGSTCETLSEPPGLIETDPPARLLRARWERRSGHIWVGSPSHPSCYGVTWWTSNDNLRHEEVLAMRCQGVALDAAMEARTIERIVRGAARFAYVKANGLRCNACHLDDFACESCRLKSELYEDALVKASPTRLSRWCVCATHNCTNAF